MQKIIETEDLIFIKPSLDLVEDYLIMANDKEVQKYISKSPKTYTYESECEWVKNKLNNNNIIFSVIEKSTNHFVGNVEFFDDYELGICITPKYQGKHYGTKILKTVIDYGFEKLGLNEITLSVYSHNEKALNCYKKLGFKEYKRDKNVNIIDGKQIDDIYMKLEKNNNN